MSAAVAAAMPVQMPGNIRAIRGLIWTYFFFLIFEGSLRMVLPALSNAILVIRDPFLIAAYLIAWKAGIFPCNPFIFMFWLLGLILVVVGFWMLPQFPLVVVYGFRVAFFHIPLIFLMSRVMTQRDAIEFGRWFLILAIPMAILMAVQFKVGPDSWLNRGLDNQFKQIDSADFKIRPPGTFSFIAGPAMFFSFVVGYLMYAQFNKGSYSRTLLILATVSLFLALAVSGSRTALAMVVVVIALGAVGVFLARPRESVNLLKFGLIGIIAFFVVSQLPIFSEGVGVFSDRIETAGRGEGGLEGFIARYFSDYPKTYDAMEVAPISGVGLGVGSNAGAAMLTGRAGFLLSESEWPRMILEMGPVMGVIFLGMRLGLAIWLLFRSLRAAKQGYMLPIMLFGACGLNIESAVWGQPTILGFTVIGAGLCVTALPKEVRRLPTRVKV